MAPFQPNSQKTLYRIYFFNLSIFITDGSPHELGFFQDCAEEMAPAGSYKGNQVSYK
jgi:hypothetical protein